MVSDQGGLSSLFRPDGKSGRGDPWIRVLEIIRGPSGRRVSKPLILELPQTSSRGEEVLQQHVIEAFSWKMPALTQFTLRT
jgi:hypothetical protein